MTTITITGTYKSAFKSALNEFNIIASWEYIGNDSYKFTLDASPATMFGLGMWTASQRAKEILSEVMSHDPRPTFEPKLMNADLKIFD